MSKSTGTPTVAVFTRDNPCTKLDLWNCFRSRRGFRQVQVAEAKSRIGANAPRGMISNGRLETVHTANTESYRLTKAGVEWLRTGISHFIKNHPDRAEEAIHVPAVLR